MRNLLIVVAAAGMMAVSGGALMACSQGGTPSTQTRPAAADLKDGITVLHSGPSGMDAAFKANGRVVYFQTRVGTLKPEVYRNEFPDEPMYEMDARFVDQEGRTFKLQIGGDRLIDPTWADDIAKGRLLGPAPKALREADFLLSRDAGNALKAMGLAPEHGDHVYHVANLAQHVPMEIEKLKLRAEELRSVKVAPEIPAGETGYNASCYWNWWEGDLYSKSIFLGIAKHSATIGFNYSNCTSTWDETVVSCNHGTCANSSNMSYQCYSNPSAGWIGGNVDVARLSIEISGSTGTVSGACGSGYNWNTSPGHDCNDDSAYFLNQIKSGTPGNSNYGGAYNFSWTDRNGNWFACNPSSGSPNDWSQPACP